MSSMAGINPLTSRSLRLVSCERILVVSYYHIIFHHSNQMLYFCHIYKFKHVNMCTIAKIPRYPYDIGG